MFLKIALPVCISGIGCGILLHLARFCGGKVESKGFAWSLTITIAATIAVFALFGFIVYLFP